MKHDETISFIHNFRLIKKSNYLKVKKSMLRINPIFRVLFAGSVSGSHYDALTDCQR